MAGKKAVQAFAEFDVGLAIQKDPISRAQKLVSSIHDTGLDEGGRVEDLAGEIAAGCDHNEPARFHVNDRQQLTA